MPTVLKSGSLNLLEPPWPVQACNGIALPLYSVAEHLYIRFACISYEQFVAVRFKFKLSTYVQEPLVTGIGGVVCRERFKRRNG